MPDRTGRLSAGECLDSEVLSAYVDGTLEPREHTQVEVHLASCGDCFDAFSEVLRIQEAIAAAHPVGDAAPEVLADPVPPLGSHVVVRRAFGRRKTVWGVAGGVLAVAAAVVLVVRLQPTWWTGGVDPKLADLVEAVGEERTIEARLTGGFKYGPLRSPVRSGGRTGRTDDLLLLAAAGRIRENAEESPTPENLYASGVGSLLIGDVESGVRSLEQAMSTDAPRPAFANGLGAAYLSRYGSHGQAADLSRALELVERALSQESDMPEALFNRALVLEAMGRGPAALVAWDAYLRVDGRSQWANEARRHLSVLREP